MAHTYNEAFMLMKYRAEDGSEEEILWNSRDGITPYVIPTRDGKKMMTHVDWNNDHYAPNHKPSPGDRVFVRLTEERAREIAKKRVDRYWDEYPVEGETKESYTARVTKDLFAEWGGDSPDILTVDDKAILMWA